MDTENAYAPDYIISRVADYYNITPEEIMGKGKTRNVSDARQMAIFLTRKLTGLTLEKIGSIMNRDHSTVLHSIKMMEKNLANDPRLMDTLRDVQANITNK